MFDRSLRVIPAFVAIIVAISVFADDVLWLRVCLLTYAALVLLATAIIHDSSSVIGPVWIIGHLKRRTYNQAYLALMRPSLNAALEWLHQIPVSASDSRDLQQIYRDTLSVRLIDRSLLFAVIYPIILVFFYWAATGLDGKLGGLVLFAQETDTWPRLAAFGGMTLLVTLPIQLIVAAAPLQFQGIAPHIAAIGMLAILCGASLTVTFAVTVASTATIAVTTTVTALLTVILVLTVAVTSVGLGAAVVAVAVAVAVSVAASASLTPSIAVAVSIAAASLWMLTAITFDERLGQGLAQAIPLAACLTIVLLTLVLVNWRETGTVERGLFLFLGIFPLINAAFDVVSYSITLALIQRGLRLSWGAALLATLDAILAALLFLGLGATLVVVVSLMNRLTGVDFVDISLVLMHLGDWRQYWWLYAMAFSTAVPTAVHLCIAALSLQALVPMAPRRRIAAWIEAREDSLVAATAAPLALGALWTLVLTIPVALAWAATNWAHVLLGYFGNSYLRWLNHVAQLTGP